MRKLLFFIPLVALFAACATDDLGMGETPSNPVADVDPLTVPLDDALGEMYSLMNDIYGVSTRAAQRTVADVATFSTPRALTRSGEEPRQLAYVVNFSEGGFAVLGARATVPSVLCITDEGEFTAAEVERISREIGNPSAEAATRAAGDSDWMTYQEIHNYGYPNGNPEPFNISDYNIDWDAGETRTDDTGDWLTSSADESFIKEQVLITTFVAGQQEIGGGMTWDEPGGGGVLSGDSFGPWTEKAGTKNGPLLRTKWAQTGEGFNDYCFEDRLFFGSGKQAYAGCVAIALAQIVAYNERPAASTFNACGPITSTWAELRSYPDREPYFSANDAVQDRIRTDLAKIIKQIADDVNTKFGDNGSWATAGAAKRYFRRNGYHNVDKKNRYRLSYVTDLLNNDCPVLILGGRGGGNRHAWVIDGYMEQTRKMRYSSVSESRTLVHCNFGWRGNTNGYYLSDVFNTSEGPIAIENGVDNVNHKPEGGHYKNDMKVIKYSK